MILRLICLQVVKEVYFIAIAPKCRFGKHGIEIFNKQDSAVGASTWALGNQKRTGTIGKQSIEGFGAAH